MRVLVMRAEADAARTAARLSERGHEAVLAPATVIVPTWEPPPEGRFDALVVTSANAVASLSGLDPLRPAFAVGARTAQALTETGFRAVRSADGDAEALSRLIAAELPAGARLLHVAGRDRKPEPAASLTAKGFSLQVWAAYEAVPASHLPPAAVRALGDGSLSAALHYSRRSAVIVLGLASHAGLLDSVRALVHVCLSADVAAPVRAAGSARIVIADHPDEDSLLAALDRVEGS